MFWEAIQEYKTSDEVLLSMRAQTIYEKFIKSSSPFKVNLVADEIQSIEAFMKDEGREADRCLFNVTESSVLLLMEPLAAKYLRSLNTTETQTEQSNDDSEIQIVGAWNHSTLPSNTSLSKKLEKELERIDFQKVHVGMETLKIEEENRHLDNWCHLLERESEVNRNQIERMQKAIVQLHTETDYLKDREEKLLRYLQNARATLDAIVDNQ